MMDLIKGEKVLLNFYFIGSFNISFGYIHLLQRACKNLRLQIIISIA